MTTSPIVIRNAKGFGTQAAAMLAMLYVAGLFGLSLVPFVTKPAEPYPLAFMIIFPIAVIVAGTVFAKIVISLELIEVFSFVRRLELGETVTVLRVKGADTKLLSETASAHFYGLSGSLDQAGRFAFRENRFLLSFRDGDSAEVTVRDDERAEVEAFLEQQLRWETDETDEQTGDRTLRR